MPVTGRALVQIIGQSAAKLGVPLPTKISDQLSQATALVTAAEQISGTALKGAVLDALAAGRDYHDDITIRGLLLDHVLVHQTNINNAARTRSDDDLTTAVVEHADTILTAWAAALEPHCDALRAAAAALPADLTDTQAIINRGAEAMRHWASAQEAITLWAAAIQGFTMLAMASRITVADTALVMAPVDAADLERARITAQREGKPIDAWTLARQGIALRLATLSDYMERSATLDQQRQAAARTADDEQQVHRKAALTR